MRAHSPSKAKAYRDRTGNQVIQTITANKLKFRTHKNAEVSRGFTKNEAIFLANIFSK